MNIDQFIVMDAVVRLGSFSAAAKELNRVQSAVSYNIRTLEEEIGAELFSREGYRPTLTQAGQAIYRRAKLLLGEVEEIQQLTEALSKGEEPLVRFDLTPTAPLSLITDALKTMAEEFPNTRLQISMEIIGGEALVHNEEVDISLTDPLQDRHEDLEILPWRNIPMPAVVAPTHPLADIQDPTKHHMLQHTQIVVRSTSPLLNDRGIAVIEGNPSWSVIGFPAKRALIRAGLGWGHMPHFMVEQDLAEGRLVEIQRPDIPNQIADLRLVRKHRQAHGPAVDRLWQLLLERAETSLRAP